MPSRNVLQRITDFNAGRDAQRLTLKYARMRADPFAFFRGSAHLLWEDWPTIAGTLNDAPRGWCCGDMHLENFGSYRGDNRLVYFDINDFDEAALAPVTCDLARLLTSTHLAGTSLGLGESQARELCERLTDSYGDALVDGKARWVERATAVGMVRDLLRRVQKRSHAELVKSRTVKIRGRRRLRAIPGRTYTITAAERAEVLRCLRAFFASQRDTGGGFSRVLSVKGRLAGTGSLGLRRYAVLVAGRVGKKGTFLIDLKEAAPSSLASHIGFAQPAVWRDAADRLVGIQHRMQAISPALLSALACARSPFVLRELQPTEDRVALGHWNGKLKRLNRVVFTMGRVLAWDHLRSASRQGAAGIDDLVAFGRSSGWREAILRFAHGYAATVTSDWNEFRSVAPAGR